MRVGHGHKTPSLVRLNHEGPHRRHALPGWAAYAEMPLIQSLLKFSRWASVSFAVIAVSIAIQHGIPARALDFVHSWARHTLFDMPFPVSNDRDDTATRSGGTIELQNFNNSNVDIIPWHTRMVEYSDLVKVATIQEGRLEVVRHPDLGAEPVLVKKAAVPSYVESIARETAFYRLLDGLGVTPLFLGHVAEGGRVTGFVAEYVQQQQQQQQHGGDHGGGTEACLSALRRMHARGVAHRDAHGGNCLVRGDGSAALVDFELAEETSEGADFERDLWVMKHSRYAEEVG